MKAFFPGESRYLANAFVIGNYAYVGGGRLEGSTDFKDFYQYSQASNSWSPVADIVPSTIKFSKFAFAINSYGYVAWQNVFNTTYSPMQKYTPHYCIVGQLQ